MLLVLVARKMQHISLVSGARLFSVSLLFTFTGVLDEYIDRHWYRMFLL